MSRNKQAKHSKEELYPLFDSYARSDESRTSFCQRHQLNLHNYNYWWAKYRKEKGLTGLSKNKGRVKTSAGDSFVGDHSVKTVVDQAQPKGRFIKMDGNCPAPSTSQLQLRTPQGIELHFTGLPPISYLQQLLHLSQIA